MSGNKKPDELKAEIARLEATLKAELGRSEAYAKQFRELQEENMSLLNIIGQIQSLVWPGK